MRIVFDKVDSLKQMSTDQVRLLVEGGMTLRKEGSQSTYSVKWAKDKNAFEVVKENKSNWGAIKSWFSHGLFGGHTSTRATRIAETLNNRAKELRTAGFATLDSRNKEHHWTSERVGKEIDARLPPPPRWLIPCRMSSSWRRMWTRRISARFSRSDERRVGKEC
jgi:hypothetical protein